jgi:hypothetical protein
LPCHVLCTYIELHVSSSFTDCSRTVAPKFRPHSQRPSPLLFKYPTCTTPCTNPNDIDASRDIRNRTSTSSHRSNHWYCLIWTFPTLYLSCDDGALNMNCPTGRTSSYQMMLVSNAGLGLFPQTLMPLGSACRTQPLITMSHFGATVGATPQDKSASLPAPILEVALDFAHLSRPLRFEKCGLPI